ncbi:MAG: T9SS type A sorting domain-containing protein [Saprospiraceae bacterium]|nr:T9SS type A sorting domain-containing protein [Saprospiraceae bacterium]
MSIKNGKAPYKVYLSGPESTNISLSQTTFKLSNLEQGTYTLYIVDANGCAVTKKATVQKAESNFDADLTPFPATCSELGSVHVATRNGVAPFRITLNGPVSGSAQANGNNFNIKNLPGGTYELTLEDANGCTFKDAFTIGDVSLDFDLTVSNGICGQTGSIKVDVAIGEAPYTIKWTGPKQGSVDISSDSYTIPDLLNGSYQIEIIDANQCSAFEVVSVNNESNQLATDAVAIDGTCGENGAILVDINNGASPYSISWTGVANGSLNTTKTSLDIPNLPEGLYKVVITDKNNCSAEHTVYVDTESALTFTASGFDGSCGQDGSIRVTITSGQANYIINWEGPITGSATVTEEVYDLTSLPSGSYNIAVTDANGCVDNAEVKIKNAEGFLSLTPVIQPATCDSTGAMALTVAGGKAPYVVEWVGPISGQLVTDAAGKLTIPDLPAGSYELYAVDQNGCTGAQAAVIETEGSDIKIALSNIDPICTKTGGIVVSIVNGNPNFNVTWDGPVSGTGTTSTSNFSIIDLPAGTYKVAVTDKFGCQAINQVTLVSSGDLDVTAKAAGAACGQGNIAVQLDKGTASFEISWTGPVSGTATTNNKNYLINDLPDGDYTISVVDINGCTDEAKVNLYSGGQPEILATPKVGFCGEAGGIGVSVSGGAPNFSLTWEGPKNGIATVSGNYFDITDLPNGKYLVTLTDANGCKDEAEVNIVNEVTNLEATTSILANSCGQTNIISVDITGGQAKYIVSWSGPQNGADTISTLNYQIKDLITGTYQISVTDAQGCQVIQTRSIQPAPIDIMKLTAFSGVCEQLGYLQVEIPGGKSPYTISWSGPVNGTTSTSGKSIKITFLPRGTYTVKITDANGCAETEVIDITYEDSSLDFTAEVEENECGQKTTALITINAGQAPYTIKWTGPESGSKSIGSSIYRIPDLQVGEYEIEITDGRGCIAIKDLKVTDPPLKLTSIEAVPGNCGALGQIVIDIKGGKPNYVISWTGPKSGTATITGNSYSINDLPDGDYNVTMSDANGCVETAKITIQNSETLEATMSGVNGNCTSAPSININISSGNPGFVIAWTGPTTGTATITNLSYKIENLVAGQYDVQITDAKGCQQSQTLNLQGIASNLKVEATGTNGSCGENGFITLKISGGTPNYTINWSGPRSGTTTIDETNFTIPQLPSGKYTVEIVDKNGCAESSSVTIVNQANLAVTIKGTNGICGGLGNIAFDFTSNPPFKITWAGASAGTAAVNNKFYNLADLKSGPYNISVTDANDCVYTQTINIYNSANDLDFTTSTTPGSCDKPGSIGLNIVGGTANFTIKWSSPNAQGNTTVSTRTYTIPQLPGGIYQITISDKNGCETTKQLELKNIDNTVKLTASVENPSCAGKGSITVGVDGSFPDFTIKWTGPSSGSKVTGKGNYTIENLSEGTYNIEVSDVNGCKQTTILTLIDKAGQPNAFFTHTSKNLTVDLLHTADTGTYLWDFGDGTTSTSPNPSYQFCEPGTYLVCLTLTNDCGTATYCSNVTVSIPADVVILDIGEKVASVASKVQVPVTMSNGSILASLAGSLEMLDPTVAVVKGLVPGLIMPQYNNLNRTFTYFHNGGQGIPVPNGTILFYIELQIIGAPGKTSAIRFSDTPLSVEVGGLNASGQAVKLAHVSLKGRVTVGISASISGNVRTYQGDPIPNAEVQLTGTDIASSEFTDAAGKFTIPDLSLNQEYTVTPKKNDLPFNGLSTYSLFIGQRFILGQEPSQIASPYQVIAGDANCNGAFSTLDLFIVQQLIIGATETFTYCPSWVFVSSDNPTPTEFDAYNVFPYKDFHKFKIQNDTTVSFIGVKVGDILGSANPDPFAGEEIEIEERNPTYLNLNTPNQQVRAGEEVILECSSKDFIDIVSYQFSLDFDTQFLEFVEFQGGSTNELAPVMAGDRWAERGQVLLSWFSQQGRGIDANVEDQLFRVRFKALQDIEDLSELISVEDLPLRAEAHSGMGDRYRIQLDWLDSFSTDPQVQQLPFKLYQNIPNPARERTEIRFDLPEASLGELRVHDHLGRLIQRQTGSFVAGHNRLSLPIADLQGGVYYYTLKAGSHTATRSMVVLK